MLPYVVAILQGFKNRQNDRPQRVNSRFDLSYSSTDAQVLSEWPRLQIKGRLQMSTSNPGINGYSWHVQQPVPWALIVEGGKRSRL